MEKDPFIEIDFQTFLDRYFHWKMTEQERQELKKTLEAYQRKMNESKINKSI